MPRVRTQFVLLDPACPVDSLVAPATSATDDADTPWYTPLQP